MQAEWFTSALISDVIYYYIPYEVPACKYELTKIGLLQPVFIVDSFH